MGNTSNVLVTTFSSNALYETYRFVSRTAVSLTLLLPYFQDSAVPPFNLMQPTPLRLHWLE